MAHDPYRPAGYLSRREAAARLNVHPDHLLRLIRAKKVNLKPYSRPAWKARRKFWFRADEVARAAQARQVLQS
ncbi:MAG: hypothetical protein ACREH3_15685 [Geminicoccales bacterium]